MRWADFLRPERVFALFAKLFLGILAFLIVASMTLSVLGRMQSSSAEAFGALVGFGLLSVIAYFIRESRKERRPRPRSTRGAERTPLLPQEEDEA